MPDWSDEIRQRLAGLRLEPTREAEIIEELSQHLDDRYAERRAAGASDETAYRAALAELSNNDVLQRELRRVEHVMTREPVVLGAGGRRNMIADLWQDLRYGLRVLGKNPAFTLVAALSLALGIGANTAIFSVINALLLRGLPVRDAQQLVVFSITAQNGTRYGFNYPLLERLRERDHSFSGIIAASAPERLRLIVADQETGGPPETAQGVKVTGNYFATLGVDAISGRVLGEADDDAAHPQPVVVLGYDFWQRRFAGDREVVGKTIRLNNYPFTIIGVMPPGFFGFEVGRKPDLWYPMQMLTQLEPGSTLLKNPDAWWFRVMARLRPAADPIAARADADAVLQEQVAATIAAHPGMLESTRELFLSQHIELEPGGAGYTDLRRQFKQPLLILLTITGLVLLVACANVANLLLARAAARQKEVAVRLALGAGRFRLIRQLLTEGVLLAVLGGALGLLFAQWGARLLLTYLPPQRTVGLALNPDARILGFTLTVSVLTGILFSLAPALQALRLDLVTALKNQRGSRAGRSRLTLNKLLVVVQVALSLFLLIGAGLFVRSLQNLQNIDVGFDRENLTQFVIDSGKDYNTAQRVNLYKQVLPRLEALPGVRSATLSNFSLLSGNRIYNPVAVPGYTPQTEEDADCNMLYVGPNFFETMGMRLLAGRDFAAQDERSKPSAQAPLYAVISETMARHFFAGADPLGKRFTYAGGGLKDRPFEVVGVVSDAKYLTLREAMPKTFYVSYFQKPDGGITLQLRTAGEVRGLAESLQRLVQEIDLRLQITGLTTMTAIVDDSLMQERFIARLSGFFSLFALLLASVGLYGVMAYAVTRRTNELGIRMALGAQSGDVIRLVMRESLVLVLAGIAVGLAAALASSRFIASLLFGLTPNDPLTIGLAALLLIAVAALAGYLPARRATKIDPLAALRYE
ncbi:MAG TPA: ABC transporter permease [Blastocatellia bacterium]|nr:ABC transporter permease [Blastocatellia bacterium]